MRCATPYIYSQAHKNERTTHIIPTHICTTVSSIPLLLVYEISHSTSSKREREREREIFKTFKKIPKLSYSHIFENSETSNRSFLFKKRKKRENVVKTQILDVVVFASSFQRLFRKDREKISRFGFCNGLWIRCVCSERV